MANSRPPTASVSYRVEVGGDRTVPKALQQFLDQFRDGESVVYVVSRGGDVQYVGETAQFPSRFKAGVKVEDKGYRWFQAAGTYTVDMWTLAKPDDGDAVRKAVEIEVAMRVRLITGYWPVELHVVNPFHFARSSIDIQRAVTIASEIAFWLMDNARLWTPGQVQYEAEERKLFGDFTDAEIRLQRHR